MTDNVVQLRSEQSLEEAFPFCVSNAEPLGNKILVQLRAPKQFSAGGIALPHESQDYERQNTAVAKVLSFGPLAYKKRDTLEPWAEGAWVAPGEYVRVPKWGGDRWEQKIDPKNQSPTAPVARFAIYNDFEVISRIVGDPLSFKDYV